MQYCHSGWCAAGGISLDPCVFVLGASNGPWILTCPFRGRTGGAETTVFRLNEKCEGYLCGSKECGAGADPGVEFLVVSPSPLSSPWREPVNLSCCL
jgi:hypothetical protein